MNMAGRNRYLLSRAMEQSPPVFVCWFEKTADDLRQFFEEGGASSSSIILPREISGYRNAQLLFCEHHPSFKIEQQRLTQLGLQEVSVVSAMDEGLLKLFGSDAVVDMMKRLGMKEDEPVSHKFISKSVQNAQKKIDKKFNGIDHHAHSQEEWLSKMKSF